ncbi:MAG: HDOD domain-containing protein [Limnobacter sp.]|nr:HDOD domain-containing protein [Limnobacter sp.]
MKVICEIVNLPPLAPTSASLMNKLHDEEAALSELAELVQLDPVLTSKLLRVANSPYFGMVGRVATLEEAIMVVGTSVSRQYVLSDLVMGYFNQEPWKGQDLRAFWNRSLYSAGVCQILANHCGLSDSMGFTLGLFQRMGSLSLLGLLGAVYQKAFHANLPSLELAAIELEDFGVEHGQIGGALLEQWNIPEIISQSVGRQFCEFEAPDLDGTDLLRCSRHFTDAFLLNTPLTLATISDRHQELFCLNDLTLLKTQKKANEKFKTFKAIIEGGNVG